MTNEALAAQLMLDAKSNRAMASQCRYYARRTSATTCATSSEVYQRLAQSYTKKAKSLEAQAAALICK